VKVTHLVHNYFPSKGGAQLVFQKLSEGFVGRFGDEVTVLTTNAMLSPSFAQNELLPAGDEMVNGVLIRRFPFWKKPTPVIKQALRVAKRVRLPLPLREYLEPFRTGPLSPGMFLATRQTEADVVACVGFPFLQMYFGLGKRRTPVVLFGALHVHDDRLSAPVLRAIHHAQAYVAFTQFERDVVVKNGMPPERVHVVGLGVDVDQFVAASGESIREQYGIGDALVVGFIGRQARYKGVDTLVRAMTTVWDRHPDAYLLLAGSRTEFSDEVEQLVTALPAAKRDRVIIKYGFSDEEKPQLFAACDVFVTISTDESFGIVFVEAWACGKPVIGGRIQAVECVIREGEDGFLVPCGEPAPLASSIERLLDDEGLRTRMGRSGQAKVRADNDWPMVVDKCHRIYADVAR
jgi:glycosyltransferase involved in cell wall biosynthesis